MAIRSRAWRRAAAQRLSPAQPVGDAVKTEAAPPESVAYEQLGDYLKALANPVRLEMLDSLRFPKISSELRVGTRRGSAERAGPRPMARQSVERHLETLQAVGLVSHREVHRQGRTLEEYVLNHQQVFAVIEELRKLTTLRPAAPVDAYATRPAQPSAGGTWAPGPKLVLVSGPLEGAVFPLRSPQASWSLGRGRAAGVQLDYDPYMSVEHAEVSRDKESWFIRDLPRSKNGTSVNFAPLAKGAWVPLQTGDIIGVGRSLMVFREA